MVVLDVAVVNVALPSMARDLSIPAVDLQWVVNAYALTFAGLLLLGGRLADLLGTRRVFVPGLALFALASLAGALAPTGLALIVARAAQGVGAALVAPVTLTILTTTFTEGAARDRALAWWGAVSGLGGGMGALFGGVLTDAFGWPAILLINVPIVALLIPAALRFIPASARPPGPRHYDATGAFIVTAGLIVFTFGVVRTDVNGWTSATTLLTLGAGVTLLVLFVALERRVPKPLVPLRIFRSRRLTSVQIVTICTGASQGFWFFTTIYIQQVLGYSPLQSGLAFVPMSVCIGLGAALTRRVIPRFGPGRLLTFGLGLQAAGMLLLAPWPLDGGYALHVLPGGMVTAFGIGTAFVTGTMIGVNGVARADAGLASGLINTSRQLGGAIALAVLVTLASQRTAELVAGGAGGDGALTAGFRLAMIVGAGTLLAGMLLAGWTLARGGAGVPATVDAAAPAER